MKIKSIKVKQIISTTLCLSTVALGAGNITSFAAEPTGTQSKLDRVYQQYITNLDKTPQVNNVDKVDRTVRGGTIPRITEVSVLAVESPEGGYEDIDPGQLFPSTKKDHGGDWLQVITFERGYKIVNYANFESKSANINERMKLEDSKGFDTNGDGVYDSFAYLWSINKPFKEGTVVSESTSNATPWNTMGTSITIK